MTPHGGHPAIDPPGVVRSLQLPPHPWKNGGGVTRDLASHSPDGDRLDWRISVADVDAPGPFSTFPDVCRVITLIQGDRMDLTVDGVSVTLRRGEPFVFSGDARVDCSLPAGPTRDLNVMTRADLGEASVKAETVMGEHRLADHPNRFVMPLAAGLTLRLGDASYGLDAFDLVDLSGVDRGSLLGDGQVLVIALPDAGL